jgi:hypothetical protein
MKIKFFITPVYPYGNDHYFHEIIVLAEGFKELGFKLSGNVNYWQDYKSKEYLINKSEEDDYEIAIYDYRYVKSFEHLLFRNGYPNFNLDSINILVDRNDWISPIWNKNTNYKIFNLILGCHTIKDFKYPKNYIPWVMGLSNRMIKAIDDTSSEILHKEIGHNFRVWHNLRKLFINEIESTENNFPVNQRLSINPKKNNNLENYFYYKKTTRRHSLEYYKIINSSLMFLGFGGYIETSPKIYQPYSLIDKIRRKPNNLMANYNRLKYSFVFQWDSFRMWELFYSNTCPIFLNFEKFNFLLPHMPKENEHYLAIDDYSWSSFEKKLNNISESEIIQIGANGKKWVMENYSPKMISKYLLNLL